MTFTHESFQVEPDRNALQGGLERCRRIVNPRMR